MYTITGLYYTSLTSSKLPTFPRHGQGSARKAAGADRKRVGHEKGTPALLAHPLALKVLELEGCRNGRRLGRFQRQLPSPSPTSHRLTNSNHHQRHHHMFDGNTHQ
jgi:hypothetical protein